MTVNEVPSDNKTGDEVFKEEEKKRAERLELEKIEAEKIKAEKIEAEKIKAEKIKAERIKEHQEYVRATIDQIISDEFIYDRYKIGDFIGRGTYGEVYKAYDQKYREYVAIKIIPNETSIQREYGEVPLVKMLNRQDPYDKFHIVNLKEDFMWRNCHILVFEWLSINLVELLKQNNHVGESLDDTRIIGTV